ncbi:MAG: hypothetical protein LQ345_002659 [Seirophora villosa]|nr:MAG: hypothetical protein LQ345_002659 [Seirophora villosa]
MSGMSSVGGSGVYEAGDQRNVKDSEVKHADRYKEGQPNSHVAIDSSTQVYAGGRTLNREQTRTRGEGKDLKLLLGVICKEARDSQIDPTLPAKKHGNEPSKGAKIDAEIQQEEEEMLKKKGIK